MTAARTRTGSIRLALVALPLTLCASAAALAQDDGAKKAQEADAKVQEQKKADATQDKSKQDESAGKNRLTGKDSAPPPAAVPTGRPAVRKPGPAPVPVPVRPKPGAGNDDGSPYPQQKPLSPEEQKKQELLRAQQKGNLAPGARGPRPPVNPNAKLDLPFGTESHDFGLIRQGDEVTHTFRMTSAGSEPVIISQASPTCGCLVGEIRTKAADAEEFSIYTLGDPIPPGAEVTIDATLQTASKQNKTQVRINVYTNDPVGLTQLALHANVEPFMRATPAFLQLGDIPEGEERTGRIDVRTSRGEKIMLRVDDSRKIPLPEGFSYELVPVNPTPEGKSNHWQVTMRVGAESKEGPKGYALQLLSDVELPKVEETPEQKAKREALGGKALGQRFYQINTNVNYRILGVLSVSPQYLSMGLVRPGQPVVRNVKLISQDPEFDLSNARVTLRGEQGQPLNWADRFSTSIKPAAGMNALDIQLSLDGLPEGADGSFRGEMLIETGHPSKPEVSVRFSGVCRKLAGVPNKGR